MKNNHFVYTFLNKSNYKINTNKSIYNVIIDSSNNFVNTFFISGQKNAFSLHRVKYIIWNSGIFLGCFLFSFNVLAQTFTQKEQLIPPHLTEIQTTFETKLGQIHLLNTPEEGNFIYGQFLGKGNLYYNERKIELNPNGHFVFAVPQDTPQQIDLIVKNLFKSDKISLTIQPRKWKEEIVNGLQSEKVQLSPQNLERVQNEQKLVQSARQKAKKGALTIPKTVQKGSKITDFPFCFMRPTDKNARISSAFGSRRILNGVKKQGHSGTDYALPQGKPVYATQDGIVLLAHPDLFYTGKTILIDHGYGITSSYSHLSQLFIKTGDFVQKGQKIGAIGTTGRSTGPHLHFVLGWHNIRVDGEQVLQQRICPE